MNAEVPFLESYWVVPNKLLAGEYPGAELKQNAIDKLGKTLEAGVTCFVDLTEAGEYDLVPYAPLLLASPMGEDHELEHNRMPIRDVSVPTRADMKRILDLIDDRIANGHVVYVHCYGGIGRTGTVVGCYLARHGLANGASLLPMIAELRRDVGHADKASPEANVQNAMVVSWRAGE